MRFALVTFALFAASASASTLSARQTVSACLNTCIHSTNSPKCANGNVACLCGDDAFVACVNNTCKGNDLGWGVQAARQLCENLPPGGPTQAGNIEPAPAATSVSP